MDWANIWQIVGGIIVSVGGAGVIIMAMSSWLGQVWAERLVIKQKAQIDKEIESYKQELQKELEAYKQEFTMEIEKFRSKAEHFNFVTKLQFETEFNAYQKICGLLYYADIYTRSICPIVDLAPEDKAERIQVYRDRFKKQNDSDMLFWEAVEQTSPFINAEVYKRLLCIRDFINMSTIQDKNKVESYIKNGSLGDGKPEWDDLPEKLQKAVQDLRDFIRDYLSTLKVHD